MFLKRLKKRQCCLQGPLPGVVLQDSPRLLLQVSEEPCILAMDGYLSQQECQVTYLNYLLYC